MDRPRTIRDEIKAQTQPEETGIPWYLLSIPVVGFVVTHALGYRDAQAAGGGQDAG